MNQNRPPYPYRRPQTRGPVSHIPAKILAGLTRLSERAYMQKREMMMREDEALAQLHLDVQNLLIYLEQEDPEGADCLQACYRAFLKDSAIKKNLDDLSLQEELIRRDGLERWLGSQPPIVHTRPGMRTAPPQLSQGTQQAQQAQQAPPAQNQQTPFPPQGAQHAAPVNPSELDYSNPHVAAEALRRAQMDIGQRQPPPPGTAAQPMPSPQYQQAAPQAGPQLQVPIVTSFATDPGAAPSMAPQGPVQQFPIIDGVPMATQAGPMNGAPKN